VFGLPNYVEVHCPTWKKDMRPDVWIGVNPSYLHGVLCILQEEAAIYQTPMMNYARKDRERMEAESGPTGKQMLTTHDERTQIEFPGLAIEEFVSISLSPKPKTRI